MNKLDLDDWSSQRTWKLYRITIEAVDYILNNRSIASLRRTSKELNIPRTSLRRYIYDYLRRFASSGACIHYDANGEPVELQEMLDSTREVLKKWKSRYK